MISYLTAICRSSKNEAMTDSISTDRGWQMLLRAGLKDRMSRYGNEFTSF